MATTRQRWDLELAHSMSTSTVTRPAGRDWPDPTATSDDALADSDGDDADHAVLRRSDNDGHPESYGIDDGIGDSMPSTAADNCAGMG